MFTRLRPMVDGPPACSKMCETFLPSTRLQVINMFDKSKRDQLIREINALYHAQCDR
jgi:hypothetical protein